MLGRHTVLGDALLTAEVWLRLLPLLQAVGNHTLCQAREAAQKTHYARLKYGVRKFTPCSLLPRWLPMVFLE